MGEPACVRLMLVGDSGAGKTALLTRYMDKVFSEKFLTTIGIDFRLRTLQIGGRPVKLQIWDTAGQDRFRTITTSYYRGVHGVLFVYDTSNRESFNHLDGWLSDCLRYADNPVMLLIGTKTDQRRQVSFEEATAWAEAHSLPLVECSAKQSEFETTIDAVFAQMAVECLERFPPAHSTVQLEPPQPAAQRCCRLG